jgi:predicted DNA-binding ribbon-helix-helix protein
MKSTVTKRSIVIGGHQTSVSLEEPFWNALKEIASTRSMTLSELVTGINADRQHGNLSSVLRLFVLGVYQDHVASGPDPEKLDNPGREIAA